MKTYEFTYLLVGRGETEDEALADALESFDQVPGEPTNIELLENTLVKENKRAAEDHYQALKEQREYDLFAECK